MDAPVTLIGPQGCWESPSHNVAELQLYCGLQKGQGRLLINRPRAAAIELCCKRGFSPLAFLEASRAGPKAAQCSRGARAVVRLGPRER